MNAEEKKSLSEMMALANSNIKYMAMNKGGKVTEYAPVSERIKAFRYVYPKGNIKTSIVAQSETSITFMAEVFDDEGNSLAIGHASENKNIGPVNKTSMVENCETGAVGRALGLAGFGVKDSVATAEGIQKVQDYKEKENHLMKCRRCQRDIIDAADKSGKVWTAEQIASMTLKAYGDCYCLPCLSIIKNTKTEAET